MPLSEPTGAQPLLNAARWVESALLGSTAIAIATLAVATLGFMMLNGRVPVRRGTTVLVGCFVLLGAATLANGIMGVAGAGRTGEVFSVSRDAGVPVSTSPPPPDQPQVYDPYAGAAVPVR
ncbi:TrbC/VirB2 family protein [Sphingomonas panni]|uniref:TrbC/VirB2 family protein n=1 Tax=Sphingomonas panni TaxID=237612 RepID=UPI003AFA3DFF